MDSRTVSDSIFETTVIAAAPEATQGGLALIQRVQSDPPMWFFLYIFALLGFYAWIRMYYGNVIFQTFQASVNYQAATRMYIDNSLLKNQLDRVLYVLYFFVTIFFLYVIEVHTGFIPFELTGGLLYLFNAALLGGILLGRVVLLNLVGFFFNRI